MTSFIKKLAGTVVVISVIAIAVAYAGRQMIKSSSVYEASRLEIQRKYGAKPEDLSVKLFNSFQFLNGTSDGYAKFALCERNACYQIDARKDSGTWRIIAATH